MICGTMAATSRRWNSCGDWGDEPAFAGHRDKASLLHPVMVVVVIPQLIIAVAVFVRLPGMAGLFMLVHVRVRLRVTVRMAVLVQMFVRMAVRMGVAMGPAVMVVGMNMHMAVFMGVLMLVFVGLGAVMPMSLSMSPVHDRSPLLWRPLILARFAPQSEEAARRPKILSLIKF